MFKIKSIAIAAVLTLGLSTTANADPCEAALCLWGKLTGGSGGSSCNSAVAKYFSIIAYRKKGKIDWGSTASQRLNHLNSCPGADPSQIKQINNKFGKVLG